MAPINPLASALLGHNGTAELQNGGKMPSDVLRTATFVVTIVVITLLAPLLITRALIRGVVMGRWCREDWTCFFAWIFSTGYCVTGLLMAIHGGGNHEWEVSPSNLRAFKQIVYADTLLYGPSTLLTKTTLLLIFTKVFAHSRKIVVGVHIFIGVMVCYYFPIMIVKIRVCTPIKGIWDPTVESKCFNQQVVFFTDAIVSVITDVVVLILPLPLVYQLKVSKIKKLRIAALLGAGGLATVASLMRAYIIFAPHLYQDMTISFMRITLLGIAEIAIGLICACLPTFNILFTRYQARRTYGAGDPHCIEYRASTKKNVYDGSGSITKPDTLANSHVGLESEGGMAKNYKNSEGRKMTAAIAAGFAEADSERPVERRDGEQVTLWDRKGYGSSETSSEADEWPLRRERLARPTKAILSPRRRDGAA